METLHTTTSGITPEKLSIMKLAELDRENGSEATATGPRSHLDALDSRSVVSRSGRRIRSSRRSSSTFISTHRNKMSLELTSKAEGKFLALMDLMASASREASSLKEFWARIVSERESFIAEREELLTRIDEITEDFEAREKHHHDHGHELGERKAQVEKLLLELSSVQASLNHYKRKITESDAEVERVRGELDLSRESESTLRAEFEQYKSENESLRLKLTAITDERDHARSDAHKHHHDLRNLTREYTELKSKYTETNTKLETSSREVITLHDRISTFVSERDEWLLEKDRLNEDLRKARNRAEETTTELSELQEKFSRSTREVVKVKEELRSIESERDELNLVIDHKTRELKTKSISCDEAEERFADISIKYEHIKRDIGTTRERLRDIELEKTRIQETFERRTEELRLITIERDSLRDEAHDERIKAADSHREFIAVQEMLRRTETTLSELRSETHQLTERVKLLDRERDEARHKNRSLITEITELNEMISVLKLEMTTISETRDRLRHEMQQYKNSYEEIQETITEENDESSELQFEINTLRKLLHDAQSDREGAITALSSADRDRDNWRAKYEEKCREVEAFEESAAQAYHSRGEAHRSTSTRTRVVSSGTVQNNSG